MIVGLDSSYDAPTAAQADAARAAGVRLWSGYLATHPVEELGLVHAWTQADFDAARRCGGAPLGFCSGWDDPVQIRQLAASWGVRACLDCEAGIRDLGWWTQDWLNASGAGLYGLARVHSLIAAFHVVARYPVRGCPDGLSWDPFAGPRPSTPCGWQCQGTHIEFECSVDRGTYDDYFEGDLVATIDDVSKQVADLQQGVNDIYVRVFALNGDHVFNDGSPTSQSPNFADTLARLEALKAQIAGLSGSVADLSRVYAKLDALGAHLGIDLTSV
jgi:hypothetical protein